ncbi:MAG TPA: peptidoglycan editing factor PgeF [Herpetosiphon sp.]|uniref:Purine nucleoside phosphorylase n=1 Tax=Herpetosiphon aurantiacus (strain ATCC 23779 / DSM 785 / 114-95) TaxID=316274 RepID=A9B4M9_HERA2|nr:peptidoglycan editing factor PgeF [Herpetosiphon sp.]ABX04194.1 protein of unknown function DUF152 [Herpetosiphon aurantiacus DSM 785]HBW48368.1 peptidoglycan editing factor PgeF [Herpetosiphon sp.]
MIEQIQRLLGYPELIHGISTRQGGVSVPPHATLNLGFSRPDDPSAVLANRRRFADRVGFRLDDVILAGQVHGTTVAVVGELQRGRGAIDRETTLPPADGLVTNQPGLVLWANFADCTPLLFFDPVAQAVGVAHAGWQGTVNNIAQVMISTMQAQFGSEPANILVAIGPAIGPCCYEVDQPVIGAVEQAFAEHTSQVLLRQLGKQRPHFDLWAANAHWLEQAGIQPANLIRMNMCTACHHDRFFSHRHERGATGRFAAVIGLREVHHAV